MFFSMNEDDVATVLSADFTCIGSDASIRALDGPTARGVPHPRTFGTSRASLGRFVRQRGTLTMPEAVRRMTSLPRCDLRPARSRHHRTGKVCGLGRLRRRDDLR